VTGLLDSKQQKIAQKIESRANSWVGATNMSSVIIFGIALSAGDISGELRDASFRGTCGSMK
jgi:hypothetical protein